MWVGGELLGSATSSGWASDPCSGATGPSAGRWGPEHWRLVRFWTACDGIDGAVVEALRSARFDDLAVIEPTDQELTAQMPDELERSRRHLRAIVDNYWDLDWRRQHKGPDESPEDHLWRAATAVADILDTLDTLDRQ